MTLGPVSLKLNIMMERREQWAQNCDFSTTKVIHYSYCLFTVICYNGRFCPVIHVQQKSRFTANTLKNEQTTCLND